MDTIGDRVKRQRHKLGYQAKYVANEVGISPAGLSLLENNHNQGVDLVIGLMLSKVLRMPPYTLAFGNKEKNHTPQSESSTPIIGTTDSGPDQLWFENDCPVLGFSPEIVEVGINQAPQSYALKTLKQIGRHFEGDIIILDPDAELVPGDDVLVLPIANDKPEVMQFMYSRGGVVNLKPYSENSGVLSLNADEYRYLHAVVAGVAQSKVKPDPIRSKRKRG